MSKLAFPGAEGFGANATGGRGGQVVAVTNTNDSGVGSLREALAVSGPKIIVFKVSGRIHAIERLNYSISNISILGQTAPGDGICISGNTFRNNGASNAIVRYLRVRRGVPSPLGDSIECTSVPLTNIIYDHVTASWGNDESFSMYNVTNATIQRSIISEALNHPVPNPTPHGYGSLIGGDGVSVYNNLYHNLTNRMPQITATIGSVHGLKDFRNNVVYNWQFRPTVLTDGALANIVFNTYINGPSTEFGWLPRSRENFLFPVGTEGNYGRCWLEGNDFVSIPSMINDNWSGVRMASTTLQNQMIAENWSQIRYFDGGNNHVSIPIPVDLYSETKTAALSYLDVISDVGASYRQDIIDQRVIQNVINRSVNFLNSSTQIIGSETGVPGMPDYQDDAEGFINYQSEPYPTHSQPDCVPDQWKIQRGLDVNTDYTGVLMTDHDGVQRDVVEVWANSLLIPEVQEYTLTVTAGTGGTVNTSGGSYVPSTSVFLQAVPSEGFNFLRWERFINGVWTSISKSNPFNFLMPSQSAQVRALFNSTLPPDPEQTRKKWAKKRNA